MPDPQRSGAGLNPIRIGVAVACVLAVVGVIWLQQPRETDAAPLTPDCAAVSQTKDQCLVTVAVANPEGLDLKGTLRVELIGPDGRSLGKKEQKIHQKEESANYKFELPPFQAPVEQLKLRCEFNKQRVETDLARVFRMKAHETSITASQEFFAGSNAVLRCGVHSVKSLTESVPLPGAEVKVSLRTLDFKEFVLYEGKAGADGAAQVNFKVPSVPPGQYTLEVATRSALGEETLKKDVKIKAEAKVLLTTDKPLYQPGQLINIRALALNPFDLTPVGAKDLIFEVEDSKGNKVFKRTHKTSDYGIASVEFQLADEVNMGDYQVRAILGDVQSQKTVTVKKYVLPKFKAEIKADKRFYLPKETIQAELQADYFFGKPVAHGKFKVTASTFDVQFKDFKTYEGKTDADGHARFEIQLPEYFVGQPLQKGDALVRLEVKLTDTADHTETITKSYPVSDQPIRVSVIPERGLLAPAMENRVFVAAIYPDGSPASCDVKLWHDPQPAKKDRGPPLATVKTNEAGLAEFRITPKQEQFRPGDWSERKIEMLGGQIVSVGGQKILFDVYAEAKDAKGSAATATVALNSEPFGENVLLRLDKAIYKGGDTVLIDVRTSAGLPTAYLDVIKNGQTLLTRWLDIQDARATYQLALPPGVFGTLEVHAYQMLSSGEIIRDSRVVYVHPREDLKIEVKPDRDVYLPGKDGSIKFLVTDAAGKPTPAALGVIVIDEAVYALQEMQPGLEKVYFTLQEELIKPQVSISYRPSEPIDALIREPELPPIKQQIAQVLLAAVQLKPPRQWEVNLAVDRRQKLEGQLQEIAWCLFQYVAAERGPFLEKDPKSGQFGFAPGILQKAIKDQGYPGTVLTDPFGATWTLDGLAKVEKGFTADRLGRAVALNRMEGLLFDVQWYTNIYKSEWFKDDRWTFPETVLADAIKKRGEDVKLLRDPWGEEYRLIKRDQKLNNPTGWKQFDYHELVSAGPDRKFGTPDDLTIIDPNAWHVALSDSILTAWWAPEGRDMGLRGISRDHLARRIIRRDLFGGRDRDKDKDKDRDKDKDKDGRFDRGGLLTRDLVELPLPATWSAITELRHRPGQGESGPAPIRVREYFPETLLWKPALITDDRGAATMPITFADSITTWRLSASASSKGGALGGMSTPLKVFQDFFIDLDLPVSLTQNDEVAFPVAVHNYLKEPQTVKLELEKADWFVLVDEGGHTRSLDLKPNEVTAVKFRIRANRIGYQPLQVNARGSQMSDAVKRNIEVVPDGAKVEKVITDRLTPSPLTPLPLKQGERGRGEGVAQTITIPDHAIDDASKILIKVYPGVFSQVIEGTEGMLRMPFG